MVSVIYSDRLARREECPRMPLTSLARLARFSTVRANSVREE